GTGGNNGATLLAGAGSNSFAGMGFSSGGTVTIVAMIYLDAVQTGTLQALARSIQHRNAGGLMTLGYAQGPNTPGWHEVRLTTTIADAATDQLRLTHGADSTNADVWWDLITIVPGVYDGPSFSGSTPDTPLYE